MCNPGRGLRPALLPCKTSILYLNAIRTFLKKRVPSLGLQTVITNLFENYIDAYRSHLGKE
jgi:hypothetical protein